MALLLYVFYMFGTNLERAMGVFRYNFYLLSGMIFTALGSFVALAFTYLFYDAANAPQEVVEAFFAGMGYSFGTFYVFMSIFLAIAVIIPDMTILLMFILPIKMKYIGIIYGVILALNFLASNFIDRIVIVASLLNFIIFFFSIHGRKPTVFKKNKTRTVRSREIKKKVVYTAQHKCTICGVTAEDAPEREFRYCSKCSGNHEYCEEHLYTHLHITEGEE
jgi:hypothetical protein